MVDKKLLEDTRALLIGARDEIIRLAVRVKELEQAWDKASELQEGYLNRIEELELERDGLREALERIIAEARDPAPDLYTMSVVIGTARAALSPTDMKE